MTETIQVKKNQVKKAQSQSAIKNNTETEKKEESNKNAVWKWEFRWGYIFFYTAINIGAFYGIYLIFSCSWLTLIFGESFFVY